VERSEVCDILEALADGVDPLTGQALPDASPYHHPRVLRALYSALLELRRVTPDAAVRKHVPSKAGEQPPGNAGKSWSQAENARLAEDFDAGMSIDALAEKHRRTPLAIQSRLVRLEKFAPSEDHRD